MAAANIATPHKAALADLTGSILASLRKSRWEGIERTNEGSPARWQLSQKESLVTIGSLPGFACILAFANACSLWPGPRFFQLSNRSTVPEIS